MAKVNKVVHVVLSVKDVMASVKFYTEAFGAGTPLRRVMTRSQLLLRAY